MATSIGPAISVSTYANNVLITYPGLIWYYCNFQGLTGQRQNKWAFKQNMFSEKNATNSY